MTMKQFLEQQADVIDATLARRGVAGRVTGGCVTPRWIRFTVTPTDGMTSTAIKEQAERLARALRSPSLRVSRRGAVATVEIPHPDPQPVRLIPLLKALDTIPLLTTVLGVCDDGMPLLVRLPAPDVGSVMVIGEERLELQRTMALSLALTHRPHEVRLALVGEGLAGLAGLPHVGSCTTTAGIWEAMQRLAHLVGERYRCSEAALPVVAFVTDLEAVEPFGREGAGVVTTLLRKGPACGVYLVAAMAAEQHHFPFGLRVTSERGGWAAHTPDGRQWPFFPTTTTSDEMQQAMDTFTAQTQQQLAFLPAPAVAKGVDHGR